MRTKLFLVALLVGLVGLPQTVPTAWHNPRLFDGTVLEATYLPTPIKSIQSSSVTIVNAATTAAVVISSVSTSNAVVRWLGNTGLDTNNPIASLGCVQLTDATHVTGQRGGGVSGSITIGFVVTEYLPQVLKQAVQQKTISITDGVSASGTATITSVNTSKTELVAGGSCAGATIANGSAPNLVTTYQTLTNATTITATRNNGGGNDSITVVTALEFK